MSGFEQHDDDAGIGATREYITVTVDGQLFGLPIERVHDVFRPQQMTPVALAQREIAGVLNMRGRIVTAIDMRRRLHLADRAPGATCMAVGIEHKSESYGLLIDEVGEVLRLPVDALQPNPVNLDRRRAHVSAGVYRLDHALLVILEVDRLLQMGDGALAA